ncbi:MAG: hypothetical protein IPK19_24750 [Chloroflexi bacterium]|nr:hypothetical protein [Chloroflexota bacterium]
MSQTTIIETDYATVWYHPEAGIVHHEFHRFIHGDQFRGVLEKGLEIFKQYGAKKWLSDDRKNSALPRPTPVGAEGLGARCSPPAGITGRW